MYKIERLDEFRVQVTVLITEINLEKNEYKSKAAQFNRGSER